ncbi:MAG: SurA N-terminal domain-containing protein [Methylobacillus sp.]|jgi:peptidyl-prolyl cis-trans isomerase D|nr:SurA N-terminal domain-containing protein [Methylobacillus sp.]
MLEVFRKLAQGKIGKALLVIVPLTFMIYGVDTWLSGAGANASVAEVGNQKVTIQEFDDALQNFAEQRRAAEEKDPPDFLENPEVRQYVLDQLISTKLLNAEIQRSRFALSDESLNNFILSLPEFQKDGVFSDEVYSKTLAANNLKPSQFEARMRNNLLTQQVSNGIAAAAFVPNAVFDKTMQVEHQQREVSIAEIRADDFMSEAKVDAQQVKDYYEKNKEKFQVPEQVGLQFVLLSANDMIRHLQITDDEVKKYYDDHREQFQGEEQRSASHILIGFGKADDESRKAALEKAQAVLAEVKAQPDNFAEFAKKYSQDSGSAQNGGDLGLTKRDGALVKPVEDAIFSMAPGAISDLVESQYGYHIIKLTGIQGTAPTFDEVKAQVRANLLYQKAVDQFNEMTDRFNELAYTQSDSLEPLVKEFGVEMQTSPLMSRMDVQGYFKSDKLTSEIFSDDVLKDKRNTSAIEVGPNTLLVARVTDHKPAAPRSFDEVQQPLEDYLKHEQSVALAVKKGKEMLDALRKGESASNLDWIPDVTIDRKNAQGLNDAVMKQAFRIDAAKLPAFDGVEITNQGYTLIRVSKVEGSAPTDADERKLLQGEMESALAEAYSAAWMNALRDQAKIKINQRLLEMKPQ